MNKTIITMYYGCCFLLLATFGVRAVVAGGTHVGFGREVAQRESSYQQLVDQQAELRQQISNEQSLSAAKLWLAEINGHSTRTESEEDRATVSAQTNSFVAIDTTIKIENPSYLASAE